MAKSSKRQQVSLNSRMFARISVIRKQPLTCAIHFEALFFYGKQHTVNTQSKGSHKLNTALCLLVVCSPNLHSIPQLPQLAIVLSSVPINYNKE